MDKKEFIMLQKIGYTGDVLVRVSDVITAEEINGRRFVVVKTGNKKRTIEVQDEIQTIWERLWRGGYI